MTGTRIPLATELLPDDVFICGYPRSGNTWFQNLATGMVFGIDPEHSRDSLIQELIPDLDYNQEFTRYGETGYFKTHWLPRPTMRRVVYLLRDGRDVMVSYKHFLDALSGPTSYMDVVCSQSLYPCQWHEHVEQWLDNPYQSEILLIRYEELHRQPLVQLRRFCEFVGLDMSDEFLEGVIRKSDYTVAKQKEQRHGWTNKAWPRDHAFIRRGEVGSYRDELPADALAEFHERAGKTLARCGYLLDES